MENKDILEIIETIGKQWPFLLVLFIIIVTFAKWKTIWTAVANLSGIKIKKDGTEIELINRQKPEEIQPFPEGIPGRQSAGREVRGAAGARNARRRKAGAQSARVRRFRQSPPSGLLVCPCGCGRDEPRREAGVPEMGDWQLEEANGHVLPLVAHAAGPCVGFRLFFRQEI